jgi:hypothetical protein
MAHSARSARLDRLPRERALAWLYTGPLGHLWGTLADIVVLWVRWGAASARARLRANRSFAERSGRG